MRFIKYAFLVLIQILFCFRAEAQKDTISGYVYDLQSHEPIVGAIIHHEGSTLFTLSKTNGYFKIIVNEEEGKLHVSVVGYKSRIVNYSPLKRVLNIQLHPDFKSLNEVRVAAYGNNKTVKETAGAVAVLSGAQIRQGSGVSLQAALNSVPGVRMDQSNMADSRISIRGNGIRSPWGMRNVKVYINGIPLTEVDGTTRIEAVDVSDLGQVEIIKGPASSIYGGGVGGVIKFKLERSPYQEQSLEASALAGSFGLNRMAITYRGGGDKLNSFVSYGRQNYDGYREHSKDKRKFLTANFQWFPSSNRMITVLLSRTSQDAQIPGTLTAEQVKENPRQAAATNLAKEAARMQNWTRIGIGQDYRFNNMLSNSTSIFTYFYDLHHPLPFGIIRNFYQSYGGRTKFDFDPEFKVFPTTFTIGGEFNQGLTKGTQYVNNHGEEGNIMSNTDYNNTAFSLFLQAATKLGNIASLELGLSYNGLTYDMADYLHPAGSGLKRFKPPSFSKDCP